MPSPTDKILTRGREESGGERGEEREKERGGGVGRKGRKGDNFPHHAIRSPKCPQ